MPEISENIRTGVCPNGHIVRPATSPSCMVGAGYYWCGLCESVPATRSMNGGPMMGMYYPASRLASDEDQGKMRS